MAGAIISIPKRTASASSPRRLCRICAGAGVQYRAAADDVDDELGAILDPLGNAVHTALAFDLVGEDVLITGAGPIGIMAGVVARHVGARHVVITDINPQPPQARRGGRRRGGGRRLEDRPRADDDPAQTTKASTSRSR